MKRKVGDRVGAWHSATDDEVRVFGYGVYEGDFIPTEAAGMIAEMAREVGVTNPRIRLDSGKVVYGCECWWGDEAMSRTKIAGRRVVDVDIDEVRRVANPAPRSSEGG
jgi:hypothetical protein